jgi:hypothetical protein
VDSKGDYLLRLNRKFRIVYVLRGLCSRVEYIDRELLLLLTTVVVQWWISNGLVEITLGMKLTSRRTRSLVNQHPT